MRRRIGAGAAVRTFGDFHFFHHHHHHHLHILAADGLFDSENRFHCMPAEAYATASELFRHPSPNSGKSTSATAASWCPVLTEFGGIEKEKRFPGNHSGRGGETQYPRP